MVACLGEVLVQRLPQRSGRLQPNQDLLRAAPRLQPSAQQTIAFRRGLNTARLVADGATRRLERADDVGLLGHIDADDAADLRWQHAASSFHRAPRLASS